MAGKAKRRLGKAVIVILILTAAAAALYLMYGSKTFYFKGLFGKADFGKSPYAVTNSDAAGTLSGYDGLIEVVESKYLWEYGWQMVSPQKPVKLAVEEKETESTTEEETTEEDHTYVEYITNSDGEKVTDENGEYVTEIRRVATETRVEIVTDESGEAVTDENGEKVTELVEQTVAPKEEESTEEGDTEEIISNEATVNAHETAYAVTDGETLTKMVITIDGNYNVGRNSVMSLTLRENTGLLNIPSMLAYNLNKGTVSLSATKKLDNHAKVEHKDGKTVITLIIPEDIRPAKENTTSFKASSTISTFSDSTGKHLEPFTVTVI